ncbi:ATP-binding protein [Acinetobacter sp. Marseille-Q1623]|uniref:ATP-binding protein n=1 Tax=Acinetobacter sp. Marseille-Q1623 TaxID=2697501 RepID=UPI00157ACF2D|nr:ATP-binding protein [Acinetobacter sp. Marseille-Q1623]
MKCFLNLINDSSSPAEQVCPIHGQTIWLIAGHLICKECAKTLVSAAQQLHEDEIRQNLIDVKIKKSGLLKRYVESGFKNYQCLSFGQENAVKNCQNFAQQIIAGQYPNLILYGHPGTGKTHLSASIIRNIILNSPLTARYYTSAQIAQLMMDTWSDPTKSEAEIIQHLAGFDLLVIDEYGLHDRHEKRLEMVHKILYSRYDSMKSTLLISNFDIRMLEKDLGVRLWSRLHENSLFLIPCYWEDWRKNM